MKYPVLCALFVSTVLLLLPATASPLDDKVASLKNAMKEEIAAKSKPAAANGSVAGPIPPPYVVTHLDQLFAEADIANMGNNAETQIKQLLSYFSSDAVQNAGQALLDGIRKERKDRSDSAKSKVDALLKHVSDAVTRAKKAEDLDAILVELQQFQLSHTNDYDPDNQGRYQQVGSAFEFTKLWQNYLSHAATGQTQQAQADLQNLSQNNYGVSLIPRSQILERLSELNPDAPATHPGTVPVNPAPSPVETIMGSIKTLDEMEPALKQLEPLRATDGEARMACDNLTTFVQIYTNIKAGLPTSINMNWGASSGPDTSVALKARVLLFVLQNYFDTYQGAAPASDEKPMAFVTRVMADATNRGDWILLQKALTAQSYLKRSQLLIGQYANPGESSIDLLLTALNQEAGAQYMMAVISYQNALRSSDPSIPAKMIGEKLAAIEKDHPKEYAAGMQIVLNPPPPRNYSYPGGAPGFPYPGNPGYPGYQPPSSVISIPGAPSRPAAAPAPVTTERPAEPASTNQAPVKPTPPASK